MSPHRCVIAVRGRIGDGLAEAFAPLEVHREPGMTSLVGEVEDQSAFFGVLDRIQAFGLELQEVHYSADPDCTPPSSR